MPLPTFLASIIGWLRAGYPDGVPESDYLPLLALLTRRLSDAEVAEITTALVEQGDIPVEQADIAVLITKLTNEMPREPDVIRVRDKLAAAGWPTA
jgi:hypothetical protein